MDRGSSARVEFGVVVAWSALLSWTLVKVWAARLPYPFDLEWMEGGILAHAWRLKEGLPLYVVEADWAPFIYPPGYPALLAALDPVAPISFSVAREVSIGASLAAAAAVGFRVRREGGGLDLAVASGLVFLGTYAGSGAFMDLARPDALSLAFLAWSIVLGLEERRGAAVAAGLLLACAFAVKHPAAAFGVPILLGLLVRGPRPALAFAASALGPGLGLLGLWWVGSEGRVLDFLLEVASSHEIYAERAWLWAPREWGNDRPLALAAGALALVVAATTRQRSVPTWAAATLPVWTGMLVGWAGTYVPHPDPAPLRNVAAAFGFWSLGAAPVAVLLWWGGAAADRWRGDGQLPSWRAVYLVGVAATAVGGAAVMRAHDGGFTNVYMPVHWVAALALGLVVARWRREGPAWRSAALTAVVCAELGWSWLWLPADRLVPARRDYLAGQAMVEALRGADGPILSPFASWLPTTVGQPPSIHAMAVWDLDREGGPFEADLVVIDDALRRHHWSLAAVSLQGFRDDLPACYEADPPLIGADQPWFFPKSGWQARPVAVAHPRPCGDP